MNARIADLIASGQATTKDLEGLDFADVMKIKSDPKTPQYRFLSSDPVKSAGDRTLRFAINAQSPDRLGDIVIQKGIDRKLWNDNPVVLWSHERKAIPPIGTGSNVSVATHNGVETTFADVNFAPKEAHEFADVIYQLAARKILKATSIGIFPREVAEKTKSERATLGMGDWGAYIEKSEMFEFSVCSIGMHPSALQLELKSMEDDASLGIAGRTVRNFMKTFPLTERDYHRHLREAQRSFVDMGAHRPPITEDEVLSLVEKTLALRAGEPSDAPALAASLDRMASALDRLAGAQEKQTELHTKTVSALSDFTKLLATDGQGGGSRKPDAAPTTPPSAAELKALEEEIKKLGSRFG